MSLYKGQILIDHKGKFVTIELKTGTRRAVEVQDVDSEHSMASFKSDTALPEPDYFTDLDSIAAIDTSLAK